MKLFGEPAGNYAFSYRDHAARKKPPTNKSINQPETLGRE